MERLQKYMARSGVASRRESEMMIAVGRVKINGEIITIPGFKIDPASDRIEVDGRLIQPAEELVYILLHKPAGYVTTVSDPQGRRKVTDLLKSTEARVYPVGRLDYTTEGLLLLTNDGSLAFRLTHPRYGVQKIYQVWVKGRPNALALRRLQEGVPLEDGMTAPARVSVKERRPEETLLEITIHEGRNRQVRRMCAKIGHPVRKLTRVAFGFLTLQGLQPGRWRYLIPGEVKRLYQTCKLDG